MRTDKRLQKPYRGDLGEDEEICQWISVWSAELKSAYIIDGKVQKALKCVMGVLDGGWVCKQGVDV